MKKFAISFLLAISISTLFAQTTLIKSGSYIINMGVTPQTIDNGLKPYGLITAMLRENVPVFWVINQTKLKDGVDFTYVDNIGVSTSFKGGTFIIPAEFITPAAATILASATWIGVVKTLTNKSFSVNVTYIIKSAPRFVLDDQNGDKAETYLNNAGITNIAFPGTYNFKAPSTLNSCDDVFAMPHADPTFAVHGKIYEWVVNQKGALYLACHSPSVFEAITAPAGNIYNYPTGTQFNMLSTHGLIDFGDHDGGSIPYVSQFPTDPVGQYMGVKDIAHLNGSEQIFIPNPLATGGPSLWNTGAKLLLYDPTQDDVLSLRTDKRNAAAITVYGRAYDNPNAGWVMYDGGHSLAKSSGPANVAAQRAFLNFTLFSPQEKAPQITTTIPPSPYQVNLPYAMSVSVSSIVSNTFTYQWKSTCAGTFSNPNGASTTFTPTVASTNCIITCVVSDPCGRTAFTSTAVVVNLGPQPPVGNPDSYTFQADCVNPGAFYDLNVLANDTDPENAALTITAVSGNNGIWSIVGNQVRYAPTANFFGTATATYTVCDPTVPTPLCATGVPISVSIGNADGNGCFPGTVRGLATELAATTGTQQATTVQNPTSAQGLPDFDEASIATTAAAITNTSGILQLDYGNLITGRDTINVYFAPSNNNAVTLTVSYSTNNTTYTTLTPIAGTNVSGAIGNEQSNAFYNFPVGGLRYIRISKTGGQDALIDAVILEDWNCVPAVVAANDDQVLIKEDFVPTISVLNNDANPGNLALKMRIVTQPANGKAVVNVDNTITYQPTKDFDGTNTIVYEICNSEGFCDQGTVTVIVQPDLCAAGEYQPTNATVVNTTLTASTDSWIQEDSGGNDNREGAKLEIGKKATKAKRAVLTFNLAAIPAGATITSASLNLVRTGGDGATLQMGVYRLTQSWVEPQVTWLSRSTTPTLVNWTTPGGTYDPTAQSSLTVLGSNGTKTFTGLASLAQFWLDNSTLNFGLLVKSENEIGTVVDKRHVFGDLTENVGDRPTLSVSYQTAAPCAAIPNRAPLAFNDDNGYTTTSTTPLIVNVIANDFDYEGDAITLANASVSITQLFGVKTGAQVGTATISGGNLLFTPASTFKGTAVIQYQITSIGGTDNARVYIKVTNSPPIAGNDVGSLVNNGAGTAFTTVNVGTNDSDPDGAGLQNPTIVSGPTSGAASFVGTILTYTPAANFVGTDVVTYQVCELPDPKDCNPNPICTTATVTFTVTNAPRVTTNVNVTPPPSPCISRTVNLLALGVTDQGALPLTVVILTGPVPAGSGTLVNNNDGTVTFTPTVGLSLPANVVYTWRVVDSDGNISNTSSLTFNVTAVPNTAPVAENESETSPMDQPYFFNLEDYVSDPDLNTLTTPIVTIQPLHGTISILNNGLTKYTPNPGYFGTDQFTYQVCDIVNDPSTCTPGAGLCDIGVITITVNAPNVVYAINDQITTWAEVAANGNVLTNDFDTEPTDAPIVFDGFYNPTTLEYVTTGSFQVSGVSESGAPVSNAGAITVYADGTYSFKPAQAFTGTVSLDYIISDSNLNKAHSQGELVIEVRSMTSTDNNLYAHNDEAVSYQTTVSENVLDNDVDPEGNTMTITGYVYDTNGDGILDGTGTLASGVQIGGVTTKGLPVANAGTLTLDASGAYTFVPAADFSGFAQIDYTVCDNGTPQVCKIATLDITVVPNTNGANNDPPFAGDDFALTEGTTPASGTLFANDSDPNGDPFTATAQNITIPEGTFVLNTNGTYTFTPAAGFTGSVAIPYTICDNGSLCASASLNVLVKEGPLTYPDVNATYVDVAVNGSVATNDKVETGTTYANPVADVGNPTGAIINLNPNGTYSFTATQPGTYTYNIMVCAPLQSPPCPTEVLTITVLDAASTTNTPVANVDLAYTQINTPVALKTLANDASGNVANNLNPASVGVLIGGNYVTSGAVPGGNILVNTTTGDITFTPDATFTGKTSYEYQVCDNATPANCTTSSQVVTVLAETTANTNLATDDYDFTIGTTPATGNVLTNDTDPEGDILSVTTQTTTIAGKGTLVLNADGSYTFTAATGFSGPVNFPYTVCDDGTPQACSEATLYIVVGEQESNPDINATFVNVAVAGDVSTNDRVLGGTTYGNPVDAGTNNPTADLPVMGADGTYTFTPTQTGVYTFNVDVCAPGQSSSCPTELLTIVVNDYTATNNPPYANTDIATTLQNTPVVLNTLANDVLGNISGALNPASIDIVSGTPNSSTEGTLAVNATTGEITFTPVASFIGTIQYTYEVCDNTSPTPLCAQAIQEVTVLPTGSPNSTGAADDFAIANISTAATGNVLDNDVDPEGDGHSVTAQNITVAGKGTFVLNTDGTFTFTPVSGFIGPVSFPYTVCDNGTPQACAVATLDILVGEALYEIGGTVWYDTDGLTDNTFDGIAQGSADPTNAGTAPLFVNFIDNLGNVVATTPVSVDGTWSLTVASYPGAIVQLSTVQGVIGQPKPATELPGGWANNGDGTGTGPIPPASGDGTPNGELSITLAANEPSINFGIHRIPTSGAPDVLGTVVGNVLQGTNYNPGVIGAFEIAVVAFGGNDPDPNGAVEGLIITALSIDILSITDGTTTVYRTDADLFDAGPCPTSTCISLETAGSFEFATGSNGQPSSTLSITPAEGFLDGSVFIDYKTKDVAGTLSDNTTQLEIPFVALKFDLVNGTGWANGSQAGGGNFAGKPDGSGTELDADKTLFWISTPTTAAEFLDVDAVIGNLIVYPGIDAVVTGCLTIVNDGKAQVDGTVTFKAINDGDASATPVYGQYKGPKMEHVTFEMMLSEEGWHNIGFPVSGSDKNPLKGSDFATSTALTAGQSIVELTGVDETHNLWWYNSERSSGTEHGFFISRDPNTVDAGLDPNGQGYHSHAYGTWTKIGAIDDLNVHGANLFVDNLFASSFPLTISATGTTNLDAQVFDTYDNWGGWNLIPNIYPVTLSITNMNGANGAPPFFGDDFDKAVWIWDPGDQFTNPLGGNFTTNGSYVAVDAEDGTAVDYPPNADNGSNTIYTSEMLIAPFQSFYIRRVTGSKTRRKTVGGASFDNWSPNDAADDGDITDDKLFTVPTSSQGLVTVTLDPAHRAGCEIVQHLKTNLESMIIYAIDQSDTLLGDATKIAFHYDYTNGYDLGYDIGKNGVGKNKPTLFTVVEGEAMVINKMAYPEDVTKVPLGFYSIKEKQKFTIKLPKVPAGWTVYLEDKYNGSWHDLTAASYDFKNITTFRRDRFVLHFSMKSEPIEKVTQEVIVWGSQDGIEIKMDNLRSANAQVIVTNLLGQVIHVNRKVSTRENYVIQVNTIEPQVYMVTIISPELTTTQKVVR